MTDRPSSPASIYDCKRCGLRDALDQERPHPAGPPYVILRCRRCGHEETLKRLDGWGRWRR